MLFYIDDLGAMFVFVNNSLSYRKLSTLPRPSSTIKLTDKNKMVNQMWTKTKNTQISAVEFLVHNKHSPYQNRSKHIHNRVNNKQFKILAVYFDFIKRKSLNWFSNLHAKSN